MVHKEKELKDGFIKSPRNKLFRTIEKSELFYNAYIVFIFKHINLFLVFLKSNNFTLGLANAIFNLAHTFSRFVIPQIIQYFKNRRNLIVFSKIIVILCLLVLALSPNIPIILAIILFAIIYTVDSLIYGTRDSLYADLIASKHKETIFGNLFYYMGLGGLVATTITIAIFYFLPKEALTFQLIFGLAILFNLISLIYFLKVKNAELHIKKESLISHIKSILKNKDFNKLIIGFAMLHFSMLLVSPFLVTYLINYLEVSYLYFGIFSLVYLLSYDLSLKLFGKLGNMTNSRVVLIVGFILFSLFPIIFILSENIYYLLFTQVIAGISWGALQVGLFAYIIDISTEEQKTHYLNLFYAITSIPAILAPFIGGILIDSFLFLGTKQAYSALFIIAFSIRILPIFLIIKTKSLPIKAKHLPRILYKAKRMLKKLH
jgi:MFS family permease